VLAVGWLSWFITNTSIVCDDKSINTYLILNFGQYNILILSVFKIIKNSHADFLSGIAKEN